MRFEVFSKLGIFGRKHYFRIRAANGEIVAQSEAYSRRADAMSTADLIRNNAGKSPLIEVFPGLEKATKA